MNDMNFIAMCIGYTVMFVTGLVATVLVTYWTFVWISDHTGATRRIVKLIKLGLEAERKNRQ